MLDDGIMWHIILLLKQILIWEAEGDLLDRPVTKYFMDRPVHCSFFKSHLNGIAEHAIAH